MKFKLIVILFLALYNVTLAQAPKAINYQAVAHDALGNIITSSVGLKFEIFQGSVGGTLVYEETHTATPSSAGIYTVHIGQGTPVSGSFNAIQWGVGTHFLRVNIDPNGGTSYTAVGASQLVSVPYALFAEKTTPPLLSITPAGTVNILSVGPSTVAIPTGGGSSGSTVQINAPHSVTNISPGNNSITIQPTTITGSNAASVSGSYPNFQVNVPYPVINAGTGTISITTGTYVSTATLATGGPWTKSGNQIWASNPGDSVGIGTSAPTSKLEIYAKANTRGIYVDVSSGPASYTNAIALIATSANNGVQPTARFYNFGNGLALNVSKNSASGGIAAFSNTSTTNASIGVEITNAGSGNALSVSQSGTGSNAGNFVHTGNGRAILATNSSTNDAVFVWNTGNGSSLYAKNNNAFTNRYAGYFEGNVFVTGKTTSNSNYALEVVNSASVNLLKIRDDGYSGFNLGVFSPAARLHVLEATTGGEAILGVNNYNGAASASAHGIRGFSQNSSIYSAGVYGSHANGGFGVYGISTNTTTTAGSGVYGITQGLTNGSVGVRGDAAGGAAYGVMGAAFGSGASVYGVKSNTTPNGNAGRFETNNTGNPDDAVFIQTLGTGSVLRVKGSSAAGANHLSVLVDDGHIGSIAGSTPIIGTTGCTACNTAMVLSHSNDVAGSFTFNMAASYGASFNYPITFIKPYRKKPVVIITGASVSAASANYYVTLLGAAGNYTGFAINFPAGISSGGGNVTFNYMIIEGSN